MSDSESVDYLQEDFDARSLTVPRLRSILVTHNVNYNATAKKQQLIDLFNDEVVPQSKKILAARARAKRSSRGIVDADSQSTTSTDFSNEQDLMPPPAPASRARSPRKTTRVKRESEDPELPPAPPAPSRASPRKRQSRSASAQLPTASDTDTAPDTDAAASRSVRRDRRTTPAPKLEPPEEEEVFFKRTPETADVFSTDNPFQSGGSSPPAVIKTPSNRRKTTGMDSTVKTKSTSPTGRRRTDGPMFSNLNGSTTASRGFEMPMSQVGLPKTPPSVLATIEPGEEFTPDEQLALAQEEHAHPELAIARSGTSRKLRRSRLSLPILSLVTVLLAAYGGWYRQQKIAVGYCGLGQEQSRLISANIEFPEWATEWVEKAGLQDLELPDWVAPLVEIECEPCPPHAYCYEDFLVRCEPDFVLKPHPLALGGIVPLPPTCEPDGEKVRRVQAVADRAVEELRDRRAKFECGEPVEPDNQPLDTPSIEELELKEVLSKKRSKRMAAEEFDELWAAAIGEIKSRDEVEVQQEDQSVEETGGATYFPNARLSSTSLARLSYTCAIQRSVKLGVARHRLGIAGLIGLLLLSWYVRSSYRSYRAVSAQVPALVNQVLDRLAAQKEMAFEDGNDDAFLFLPNLRDDVLRSMHSLAERDRIWQRVRAVVEQNSNVRTGQREGHNGEVGRAWEWIGPSRLVAGGEGASGSRRRKSARVSWGPDVKGEIEDSGLSSSKLLFEGADKKPETLRKWEESRPIY
ncbi:Man1-Src1p-C-terminal domain-containing protein [Lasiosphaeria miniovina]|uniref:Man1-Src1p-C-terminal domain-containing protein n=1 Tax=Lasiosphaeria miniovina TaxID=1954250 RepID=A0AA39ZUI1_9PEZI|nr:Man1-Src1p-C-terminal domain-containing protein [Lasiosphaeria miniovina]KAK0703796.1 Man1-Src1p-C-terminal domain-containing protein [Lasiosphaeria miniovina]